MSAKPSFDIATEAWTLFNISESTVATVCKRGFTNFVVIWCAKNYQNWVIFDCEINDNGDVLCTNVWITTAHETTNTGMELVQQCSYR